ncbi:MAG: tol-pal system protein YbgF [Desulfatitalea sp.]|nr:tol-pal system protein YbgF [Desulfatitalea sp.]NNK01573.1 tol-pal system protein YbgF [Desulfatitalea sp.]
MERQNQELKRQNLELQKQLAKELEQIGESRKSSETQLRSNYASMNANLGTAQEQVLVLTGRIEEISFNLEKAVADEKQQQANIDAISVLAAKIDQRLKTIEQYLNLAAMDGTAHRGPDAQGVSKDKQGAVSTVDQMYADAKLAYDEGRLEKARQGFQQLLETYPKSSHADNAQFWIGESYYREKWYEKAILEYQAVIEKYPKGNKVTAAMLKQGMAFLQIGDQSNARLILKELQKKYPKSNEAKIATKKLQEF